MKKSDLETRPESPISFHPSSNGEFEPRPVTDQERIGKAMQRLGITMGVFVVSAYRNGDVWATTGKKELVMRDAQHEYVFAGDRSGPSSN